MAREQGLRAIDKAAVQATIGLSWEVTWEYLASLLDSTADADELFEIWPIRYDALARKFLALKPGATELLIVLERMAIPREVAAGSLPRRRNPSSKCACLDRLFRCGGNQGRLPQRQASTRPACHRRGPAENNSRGLLGVGRLFEWCPVCPQGGDENFHGPGPGFTE